MTERPARPARRRPGPLPVVCGSIGVFLVVLTLLAAQLRAGRDPALGAGPAPVKRVLVHRVEERTVIARIADDDAEESDGFDQTQAPAAVGSASPAPAPAPAPVTTRSS